MLFKKCETFFVQKWQPPNCVETVDPQYPNNKHTFKMINDLLIHNNPLRQAKRTGDSSLVSQSVQSG